MNGIRKWFNLKWLMVAVAALLTVLVATHVPQEVMPKSLDVHLLDKIEHVVAYGAVAFLFSSVVAPHARGGGGRGSPVGRGRRSERWTK